MKIILWKWMLPFFYQMKLLGSSVSRLTSHPSVDLSWSTKEQIFISCHGNSYVRPPGPFPPETRDDKEFFLRRLLLSFLCLDCFLFLLSFLSPLASFSLSNHSALCKWIQIQTQNTHQKPFAIVQRWRRKRRGKKPIKIQAKSIQHAWGESRKGEKS